MAPTFLQRLGLRPLINANATLTRLGGSLMPDEVREAMDEAARAWVDLHQLQRRVGERLAELTRNEAAYVSTGAAAGIVLAVAACMTRGERERIALLPSQPPDAPRDEVIVFASHRNPYDAAVLLPGARMVFIGDARATTPAELEAAITPRTAALIWFQGYMTGRADFAFERVVQICRAHDVPVIVDAAAQLPPLENLWRFTHAGASVAIFSGGKALQGPQGTGMMLGARWLIEAVRAIGSPNQGFGRPMKVAKEDLAGLLAAVERYTTLDHAAKRERDERVVADWCGRWNALAGVRAERSFPNEAGQPLPRVLLRWDRAVVNRDGDAFAQVLLDGDPSISVDVADRAGAIYVNPWCVADNELEIVALRVAALLRG
jgi:L-seryl-tRNA(Ser) seleniumtransferase